ncbi:hypothetical protein DTO164E3_7530 [Paecilomyces variotii]|nr:hypothetical protein DTO032I3_8264 [Paecilomyces variotii]KAJ9194102.1 hypothetical protein DTO164E3_7530 [Paecilomyces variotii]KAJ9254634.1 hypothetical protein DTO207G8_3480 [Paecilomyces variotii]KAJ9277930.1 hypothetical protein DTO021D3_5254 [Paecilomyces variotii]KAJ9320340.1 hypothetical protein DTO027B3_8655 [Paecilomyces variotii]
MASAQMVQAGGISLAIRTLHSFLPLVVAVSFAISYIASALRKNDHGGKLHGGRSREIVLWMISTVLTTYCLDSVILIYAALSSNRGTVPQDHIVFSLSSVLLWIALIFGFVDYASTPWYPFYGPWVTYMVTEAALLGLSTRAPQEITYYKTMMWIQILRLCVLCSLLCFSFSSDFHNRRARRVNTDEETAPLLAPGNADTNHLESPQQCSLVNNYETINGEGDGSSDLHHDRGKKGDPEKQSNVLEDFMFLLPFFWPKTKPRLQLLYGGVGLCLVVDRVLNIFVPIQLGLITNILSRQKETVPWKEIVVFAALRFLDSSGGVSAIRRYLWQPLENFTYHEISTAAFNKIMTLSSDFHDNKHSGSLWQTVSRGRSIRHVVDSVLFQIGPMIVDLVLAVSILYYLFDAYMALITAAVFIFYLWSSSKILAKQKDKQRQLISTVEKEYDVLCESTSNWQTISYFNRVDYEKDHYSSAVKNHMNSSLTFTLWSNFESVAQSFLLVGGLTGACFLAAYQVAQGRKSVGSFVMLLSYWAQLSGPLRFFAHGFCNFALDMIDAEELVRLLRQKPTIHDHPGAKELVLDQGEITFDKVCFSYDGRRKILKDVSFRVRPGETVALVGETGGGKSTILKLISRFYDPESGKVTIDGQDIRDVTLDSLRANIGIVPQDPALFHDTIINNIRYANPSATDEEIYEACKAVALHDKFLSFPDGYRTLVGERGVKLSGGELQRVAIARVIIRDPSIVLLDEATSSVDSNTEMQIQNSLGKLTAGRTTLVIAHRLSTVINADKILVIDAGNIVEEGPHEELLKRKGNYYRLWSHQSSLKSSTQKRKTGDSQSTGTLPAKGWPSGRSSKTGNGTETVREISVRSDREPLYHDDLSTDQEEGYGEPDLILDISSNSFLDLDKDNLRTSSLKPDAPEFIPQRLQRTETPAPSAVYGYNTIIKSAKDNAGSNHIGKENYRGKATAHAECDHGLASNGQASDSLRTVTKRSDIIEETSSTTARVRVATALGLQRAVNCSTVNADVSPSKAHKHKKKRISRKRLSKSEPPSLG